jgi:hypothetical protein
MNGLPGKKLGFSKDAMTAGSAARSPWRSAAANELQFIRLEDALDLVVRVH